MLYAHRVPQAMRVNKNTGVWTLRELTLNVNIHLTQIPTPMGSHSCGPFLFLPSCHFLALLSYFMYFVVLFPSCFS